MYSGRRHRHNCRAATIYLFTEARVFNNLVFVICSIHFDDNSSNGKSSAISFLDSLSRHSARVASICFVFASYSSNNCRMASSVDKPDFISSFSFSLYIVFLVKWLVPHDEIESQSPEYKTGVYN